MIFAILRNKLFLYFGEHGAELDYVIGVTITDLTNLKNSANGTQLSPAAITAVIVSWNYLDAVYNFMFALSLFTNKKDYRYKQNIVKGIINFFEGVELFVLSYNPPLNAAFGLKRDIALAGTAFAIGTVCDLICASIDFYNISKELYFPGWLEEKTNAYKYALAQELETKELVKDIRSRCKAYIDGNLQTANALTQFFKNKLPCKDDAAPPIQKLISNLERVTAKNRAKDQLLQEQMDHAYKKNRTYLGIKLISMIGMILLAVSGFLDKSTDKSTDDSYPSTLTIGLALTTLVASYYFLINAERLANQADKIYNRFFPAHFDIKVTGLKELNAESPALS